MKAGIIACTAVAIMLTGCSAASSLSRKEKAAAEFKVTADLIESGTYLYTIRSATPMGGKSVQITSLYTMEARNDTFRAHLPYFGRAYTGGYGNGGGVEFDCEVEELEVTRDDEKNSIIVAFSAPSVTETEKYSVSLKLSAAGYGNLVVASPNRQTISYYGMVSELKD